ncbi:DUF5723 family protein [Croceitalea marina]|uniref:DUF5723 family protein n=1 Tax=Croceitalea marina TaxID=1775166 RepID=A0ABW5N1T8_9FLAO
MIKIRLVLFTMLFSVAYLGAQNKQLLYDFYEIPQSLLINPGVKTPYKWHAGIPAISGIAVQAGTSGITLNDLFANDGIDFTDKVRDKVVNGLSQRDEFGGSLQLDILNIGFRNANRPEDYYSFGVYGELSVTQYWPKDLAILAFEGNANNLNRRFSLSHLTTFGEGLSVFHFGINRKVSDKLRLGARGKIYSSIFEAKSKSNSGYFVTTQGQNNLLRNTLVADVQLQTSGLNESVENEDSNESIGSLLARRALFGGNLGLGFDVGFTYQLNEKTSITGSLLDVGFINHTKDVKNFTLEGTASNEGIEIILPESFEDLNSDIWENLIDDIEAQVPFETNSDSYITLRPIKLNASIRYNIGEQKQKTEDCYCGINGVENNSPFDYKNAVGGHLFIINKPKGPQAALTAFYQTRIGNALALKATYTADKFTFTNIGLGLNFQAGPVNFYILGDNLLGYRNIPDSNYASLQFGFNIISWNRN